MQRVLVLIVVFLVSFGLGAVAQETPTRELGETESLKLQLAYKDFVIEQQKYDVMFQKFLALTEVKVVTDKIGEMQRSLAEAEKKVLDAQKLSRNDFFLDFTDGKIKPVPKQAPKTE